MTTRRGSTQLLHRWTRLLGVACLGLICFNYGTFQYAQYRQRLDYRTYLAQASRCIDANDLVQAANQINQATHLAPDQPEPYLMAGHLHFRTGHWEQAVHDYALAIEHGSPDPGARLNSVWACIELKQYDKAVEIGNHALADQFTHPALYRYIAEAYARANQSAESIPFFEKALEQYPDDLYLAQRLRDAYRETKQLAKIPAMDTRIESIHAALTRTALP